MVNNFTFVLKHFRHIALVKSLLKYFLPWQQLASAQMLLYLTRGLTDTTVLWSHHDFDTKYCVWGKKTNKNIDNIRLWYPDRVGVVLLVCKWSRGADMVVTVFRDGLTVPSFKFRFCLLNYFTCTLASPKVHSSLWPCPFECWKNNCILFKLVRAIKPNDCGESLPFPGRQICMSVVLNLWFGNQKLVTESFSVSCDATHAGTFIYWKSVETLTVIEMF